MAIKTPTSLKSFFESGDVPTCAQFVDLIDSTYSGELIANVVSAADAGSTGLLNVASTSGATFVTTGSAGLALVSAGTQASARTALGIGSAGDTIVVASTQASLRTAIGTAATTNVGLIEIATTAEALARTDAERAITPANQRGVVQVVSTQDGEAASGTTLMPRDDTIPQITEGDEYMTLAITPKNTNNTLRIDVVVQASISASGTLTAALFQDATANALKSIGARDPLNDQLFTLAFTHIMTAGTTSATTFRIRMGSNTAGTTRFNSNAAGRQYGGVAASSIVITEIAG